jgi:MATE family multidrug resistance protein
VIAGPPVAENFRAELRIIARLAVPIAFAQAGLVTMGLVDTAVVGRVSVDDLAAVAMGRSLFFASVGLGIGTSLALEPLAAQAVGAGEPGRAWSALGATLRAAALAALIGQIGAFLMTLALEPLGFEPALVRGARVFLLAQLPGAFLFVAYVAGRVFLQAHGETRPALVAMAAANVVNLVACSLLVRGDDVLRWVGLPPLGLPRLGALGAGIASSFASLLLAVMMLATAVRHRPAQRPAPGEVVSVGAVIRLGTPIGLQLLAEIGVFACAALAAGRMGARIVSAHQIAVGLASFSFMAALGVSGATAVRVGHAVGAGLSPRRPGVAGILLGAAIMAVSAVVFATFPRPLIRAFTADSAVIEIGVPLLGLAAIFQVFDGVQAVAAGALRGAGDVRYPFLACVGAYWGIAFPLAIGLGFGLDLGAPGIWIGLTAGLVVASVVLTARYLRITRGHVARV